MLDDEKIVDEGDATLQAEVVHHQDTEGHQGHQEFLSRWDKEVVLTPIAPSSSSSQHDFNQPVNTEQVTTQQALLRDKRQRKRTR